MTLITLMLSSDRHLMALGEETQEREKEMCVYAGCR